MLIGQVLEPAMQLEGLRKNVWSSTDHFVSFGPNSGLSLELI